MTRRAAPDLATRGRRCRRHRRQRCHGCHGWWTWSGVRLGAALSVSLLGVGVSLWPGSALGVHAVGPVATVPSEDLDALRRGGEAVVVIDLRGAEQYRRGHLPGARSVPLRELWDRLGEVPATGRVVLYADTNDEAGAAYAALRLRGRRNMVVLEDGLAGWMRRGLPLETLP